MASDRELANYLREIAPKCSAFSAACPESLRRAADIVEAAENVIDTIQKDKSTDSNIVLTALRKLHDAVNSRPVTRDDPCHVKNS